MKRKVYKIILITLLIIEIPIMYLTFRSFANRDKDITKVSYNENIKTKSTLAYYIDGELQEGMTSWPTDKEYEKAECYYGNHVEVPAEEVLSFDNASHTAIITSNKTVYCSLYFGKAPETPPTKPGTFGGSAGLIEQNSGRTVIEGMLEGTLESEIELCIRNETIGTKKDDLRRFTGTKDEVTDNFICFGTNSQKDCKDNMDTYMYRIIGIDTAGRLKVIKATKLAGGTGSYGDFAWNNKYTSNITWPNSDLYKRLNGTTSNGNPIFIENDKYSYMQEETWTKLIDTPKYYMGDTTSSSNPTLFQNERTKSIDNAKIGLMYASDYLYASSEDTNNWLFIQNGLNGANNTPSGVSQPTTDHEWTMTRYGWYNNGYYYAWSVDSSGSVTFGKALDGTGAVRPVFYLRSDIKITGGNGDINTPYIISPE